VLKKLEKAGSVYSQYNINVYNELFYKFAQEKLINELPNLFTKLDLFNIALHKKITSEVNSKVIKVMELASGNKMDKWETLLEIDSNRKWKVLLTDFDKTLLPDPNTIKNADNFEFLTGIYSLFDKFPKLKPAKRFDAMLSTYTFDNLWLKDDLHLMKVDNIWYKMLYRLDPSSIEACLQELRKGKKLNKQYFKNLKIETRREKINIFSLSHGMHIDKYFKNHKNISVNYPGGLISTVINSYHNQLKKKGLFITADIATEDMGKKTKCFKTVNETIKIKIENYALAKYILEKLGFYVRLKNLHDFIKEAGIAIPVKIYDHFVLAVQLKE